MTALSGADLDRLKEAEADADKWLDAAHYEVGGAPCLWSDRAKLAERKLHDYGHEDWYCGYVNPNHQRAVPSYRELRNERDALARRARRLEAALRPFAHFADLVAAHSADDEAFDQHDGYVLRVGDFRRARAILSEPGA